MIRISEWPFDIVGLTTYWMVHYLLVSRLLVIPVKEVSPSSSSVLRWFNAGWNFDSS